MRRINFIYGIKQRINEMLGRTPSKSNPTGSLTAWSLQQAMLTNMQRIVSSLVGVSIGRPMKGLWMRRTGDSTLQISSGFGFTQSGNIVSLGATIELPSTLAPADTSDIPVYIKHELAVLEEDGDNGGLLTNVIGETSREVVADDKASTYGDQASTDINDLFSFVVPDPADIGDYVYLGTIDTYGPFIVVDSVVNTDKRGLAPNGGDAGDENLVPSLTVSGALIAGASVLESLIVNGTLNIGGATTFDNDEFLTLPAADGKIKVGSDIGKGTSGAIVAFPSSMEFKNGILVGYTA